MRIPYRATGHSTCAGLVGCRGDAGHKLGGQNEPAGADDTLQQIAAADVLDDCLILSGFHFRPPSRRT